MTGRGTPRALAARLLAAAILAFLGLASCATFGLVAAECMFRAGHVPAFAGNAAYWKAWPKRMPAQARDALRRAVAADPRDSSAWIALGLATEGTGEFAEAARDFETAERVDRQFLPAASAANFYFRRGDAARFWPAAARAAGLAHDDLAPVIDLADRMEPDPLAALARLGPSPDLERSYLNFLILKQQWAGAERVAWKMQARRDPLDHARLLDLVDRLIAAERGNEALALCRRIAHCPVPESGRAGALTNGRMGWAPSGHGFDWRAAAPAGVPVQWQGGQLGFRFSGSEPDQCVLLEEPILVASRRYRLRFEYRIPGAGLRWMTDQEAAAEQVSPAYDGASDGGEWRMAEWHFTAARAGLARLRLLYRREPGALLVNGEASVRHVSLEIL